MEQTPNRPAVRRYPRMNVEYVIAYRRRRADGSESPQLFSRTRSLGLGGAMFETESPLEIGETLKVEIVVGERTMFATGVVIYTGRDGAGPWQNGLQFVNISEEDRDALMGDYLQREYRIPSG